jgi:hypothetical protein
MDKSSIQWIVICRIKMRCTKHGYIAGWIAIRRIRDAGTTGAAGASAPLAFCIFNFVGAVRVQTMGVTGAQKFYNRQN